MTEVPTIRRRTAALLIGAVAVTGGVAAMTATASAQGPCPGTISPYTTGSHQLTNITLVDSDDTSCYFIADRYLISYNKLTYVGKYQFTRPAA